MIIVDSYKYRKYLLDRFPATVAYSLRKIRTGQTRAIRVRRSSDNAEQDIGFIGDELDTVSLLSFVGANNGLVTTWYDQSGNGYNATQTTQAHQPEIVSSGAVITDNGKPSVSFNGSHWLDFPPTTLTTPSVFMVAKNTVLPVLSYVLGGHVQGIASGGTGGYGYGGFKFEGSNFLFSRVTYFNVRKLYSILQTKIYQNGVQETVFTADSTGSIGSLTVSRIGARPDVTLSFNGLLQEIIAYNTDQTANRTAIESNINTYYSIY